MLNKKDLRPRVLLGGDVVMRVASTFILSSGTVGISITTLPCLNAAPWWGAGELTSRAATWTGGCSGRLRTCTQ